MPESSAFLVSLVRELRPDVLHLNQFCYGNLPVDVPRVVMAHGDLITWTQAVHDRPPRPERSFTWYRKTVLNGLAGADAVVAPSAWMLDRIYCLLRPPAARRSDLSRTQSDLLQSLRQQRRLRAGGRTAGRRQQTGFSAHAAARIRCRCASSAPSIPFPCRAFRFVPM